MTGFHFTGTAVPILPESRFPFHRIPGSLGLEYSPNADHPPAAIPRRVAPQQNTAGLFAHADTDVSVKE